MQNIIYISTIGINKDTKKPRLGTLTAGIYHFRPQDIEKVILLIDEDANIVEDSIITDFPYLTNKIIIQTIDAFNYKSLISAILKVFKELGQNKSRFIINITGGTKIMSIGAYIAANLIGARVHYIKEKEDLNDLTDDDYLDILMPEIPIFEMKDIQKLIIYVLEKMNQIRIKRGKTKANQTQLRHELNQSQWIKKLRDTKIKKFSAQNLSHHINFLVENRLIIRTEDETNKKVNILELTSIGKMVAQFLF